MYHKPQATPWYIQLSCTMQSRAGPYLGTDCARGYQIAARRYCVKGRGRFSWGRRSHSCRCELLSLVVATCVETIADAEQQLNKTVVSSRLLLGVERLLFSLRCWVLVSQASRIFPRAHARGKGGAHAHEEKYGWLARLVGCQVATRWMPLRQVK